MRLADLGCSYLLSAVGTPVELNAANFKAAFVALRDLHRSQWCHGDARLPNLPFVGGSLRWIDMAFAKPYSATGAAADAWQLAHSLANCPMDGLSGALRALLAAVSDETSDATLHTLSTELWEWSQTYSRERAAAEAL